MYTIWAGIIGDSGRDLIEVPGTLIAIGPNWIIRGIVRSGLGAGFTPRGGNYGIRTRNGGYFYPDTGCS